MIPAGDYRLYGGDDNLGQFRIIQAEQRFRSALRWLADFESATWPEVRMFLASYCPPGDMLEALIFKVDEWEGKLKPSNVAEKGRSLRSELYLAMASFRRGLDPLSLVGSIVSPLDQHDTLPWDIISERAYLRPFQGDGGFLTITGPPRQGKTGVAMLYAEMFLRHDPRAVVLSNVILSHPVERFHETEGMRALIGHVKKAIPERRKWLWIFDDAGLEWLKQRAMAGTALDLERFARIVPKHGGSFIYIDQREGGVPTTISEFAESRIRCLRPGFAVLRIPDLPPAVRDIPRPLTPYISEARSTFSIDMTFEELSREIPRPPQGREVG